MMKVQQYEEGNKVKVFYDPHNPNESILEKGLRYFTFFLMFIVGIGLFLFGFFAVQLMIYDLLFP
jgi:hypothetical protein